EQAVVRQEQSPKAGKVEWNSKYVPRCALKAAGVWVVNVNFAVTEITDPELAIHNFESPWRVQSAVGNQTAHELPIRIEDIDDAVARPSQFIIRVAWIAWHKSDEDFPIENANPKRCVTRR